MRRYRVVGVAIAVHPPKFYAAAFFLRQWWSCSDAVEALSIHLVFSSAADLALFRDVEGRLSSGVPAEAWTAIVALEPLRGWEQGDGQGIAAYKKWHGIAYLMDLGDAAPEFGIMIDAEVVFYDRYALAEEDARRACRPGGPWSALAGRLRSAEAAKLWPAAQVSSNLTTYVVESRTYSGRDYDRNLIRENTYFLDPSRGIEQDVELRRQIDECLFSWWTDLPWVNLKVAQRLLTHVSGHLRRPSAAFDPRSMLAGVLFPAAAPLRAAPGSWLNLSRSIKFPRFEHICYQQWAVLMEGFAFRDVTNLTGYASWGSYLEDPLPGARLDLLHPLWVSSEAFARATSGRLPQLSRDMPPLLIFHADHHGGRRFYPHKWKEQWERLLLELMAQRGRLDFDKDTIKL